MFKLLIGLLFFISPALTSNIRASDEDDIDDKIEDNIADKLPLGLRGYDIPFGGVMPGLEQWLKKNHEPCSGHDVYVLRNDEGGDPDSAGCYIVYGPDDSSLLYWTVSVLIINGSTKSSLVYKFDFTGRDFILKWFDYENMALDDEKAKRIVLEISRSEEAKAFGQDGERQTAPQHF